MFFFLFFFLFFFALARGVCGWMRMDRVLISCLCIHISKPRLSLFMYWRSCHAFALARGGEEAEGVCVLCGGMEGIFFSCSYINLTK